MHLLWHSRNLTSSSMMPSRMSQSEHVAVLKIHVVVVGHVKVEKPEWTHIWVVPIL